VLAKELSEASNNEAGTRLYIEKWLSRWVALSGFGAEGSPEGFESRLDGRLHLRNTSGQFCRWRPSFRAKLLPAEKRRVVPLYFYKAKRAYKSSSLHQCVRAFPSMSDVAAANNLLELPAVQSRNELVGKSKTKNPSVCLEEFLPDIFGASNV
jgi:hypothetical protein